MDQLRTASEAVTLGTMSSSASLRFTATVKNLLIVKLQREKFLFLQTTGGQENPLSFHILADEIFNIV